MECEEALLLRGAGPLFAFGLFVLAGSLAIGVGVISCVAHQLSVPRL